jgi:hypothetical protein
MTANFDVESEGELGPLFSRFNADFESLLLLNMTGFMFENGSSLRC